jgi:hypothetical protein
VHLLVNVLIVRVGSALYERRKLPKDIVLIEFMQKKLPPTGRWFMIFSWGISIVCTIISEVKVQS